MSEEKTKEALDALERLLAYTNGLGACEAYTIRAALLTAQGMNKELSEALNALNMIDRNGPWDAQKYPRRKAFETIRSALTAQDVNDELLEALKGMVARFYYDHEETKQLKAARQAIARAETQKVGE